MWMSYQMQANIVIPKIIYVLGNMEIINNAILDEESDQTFQKISEPKWENKGLQIFLFSDYNEIKLWKFFCTQNNSLIK